jgi:uncharacterized protein YndB with AHSA1/START domain
MTDKNVAHGVFTVERTYPNVMPQRVFDAFATEAGKVKWFSGPRDGMEILERAFDFRVGGRELLKGRWSTGSVSVFDALYFDITPGERIIYAYDLWRDGRKLSVSLATLEFQAVAGGTRFVMTEQGAFLDGYDDAGAREQGTNELVDQMAEALGFAAA